MTNHFQPAASGATASRPSTPHSALRTLRSDSAFTLIEILVVVSIIAILSALILATAGYAMSKARRSRVETELATLVSAIQSYKAAKGFYPQDNPTNPAMSPLYYELTGTTITLNNANPPVPVSYFSATSGDTLNAPADFTSVYGPPPNAVAGFVNASPDASQVQNFFGATGKSARTAHILTNGVLATIFCVPVAGPVQFRTTNGSPVSPWFYNSSNPTNNANGGYDLWMDVFYSGRTNRISNWSQNPQPQ
jgi:prepilin-type N-terminal cleavage/methylation domain-containing protein